ncbi:MAG: flagellar export protein FliJ [Gammaproteobacteria bacterium]|nr:flagellar export protein FliJ [Gammaproteobacteria bacterium]
MRKSKRMEPVLRVAASREDKAAQEFGASRRQLDEHERQLAQLQGYRREYQARFETSGAAGISAARLLDTRRFLAQLDQAIAQQQQAVSNATRLCEQKRQLWLRARQKSQTFIKAKERFEAQESLADDKRDQKASDELAQRKRPSDE